MIGPAPNKMPTRELVRAFACVRFQLMQNELLERLALLRRRRAALLTCDDSAVRVVVLGEVGNRAPRIGGEHRGQELIQRRRCLERRRRVNAAVDGLAEHVAAVDGPHGARASGRVLLDRVDESRALDVAAHDEAHLRAGDDRGLGEIVEVGVLEHERERVRRGQKMLVISVGDPVLDDEASVADLEADDLALGAWAVGAKRQVSARSSEPRCHAERWRIARARGLGG